MKARTNGGYSLLELLVAVVILAIIAAPFLHSFLISVKTNEKAKKAEQATIAGQNVMEELKAADIEDIEANPIAIITNAPGNGGKVITFTTEDITVDNRVFQAKVTLDSRAVSPAEGADPIVDPEAKNEITDYNRDSLAQIYKMDRQQDGFYVQPAELDTQMASKFGVSADTMTNIFREITLDINKTGNNTTAEVGMKYTCNGVERYTTPQRQCIYTNTDASVYLRNIYIFFYPMYNSNGGIPKETITINNNDCIPVNVYLIKQKVGVTGNEALYKVNVQVMEKNRTEYIEDGVLKPLTTIRTNLSAKEDLSVIPLKYKQLAQLTYSTDGISFQSQAVVAGSTYPAEQLLELKGLSADAAYDRVYRTTVEVYEKDDAEHEILVSLTGTKEK